MFLICTKDLWCTVSVHVSRSNEGKMAFAGVVTLRPNLNAKCAHSCLWVRYLWSCLFFGIPSSCYCPCKALNSIEDLWTSQFTYSCRFEVTILRFRNLIELNTDCYISGFSSASGYGLNYFRFFPINLLLRNVMEECQNVGPYRYFAVVGQRASSGNYVGHSLANHNMFHFAKLALDSDQCFFFASFLDRNQRQLKTRSN